MSGVLLRTTQDRPDPGAAGEGAPRPVDLAVTLTAIISDLHSNWPALETALADARGRGAQRFVCLGDVIGYGARPCVCLDEVLKVCTEDATFGGLEPGLCLLGNHEYAILNHAEDFNPNARAAIDWTRDQINGAEGDKDRSFDYWDFLGGLEPMLAENGVLYAHGSPRDPVREYLLPRDARDEDKMASLFAHMREASTEARVCFVGHSHVPGIFYEDGRYYRPKGIEGPSSVARGPSRSRDPTTSTWPTSARSSTSARSASRGTATRGSRTRCSRTAS